MRVVAIALVLWRKNPLIGNGSGFFYDASQGFIGTHITTMNVYVEQLVEYGIIGMMFYIIYIVYILKVPVMSILVKRNINFKASPEIIAAISAWLLISYSLDTFSKILIWVMPAIVLSLLKFEQEDKDNIIEPELYIINPSRL
jgi:O-antigen ligase